MKSLSGRESANSFPIHSPVHPTHESSIFVNTLRKQTNKEPNSEDLFYIIITFKPEKF